MTSRDYLRPISLVVAVAFSLALVSWAAGTALGERAQLVPSLGFIAGAAISAICLLIGLTTVWTDDVLSLTRRLAWTVALLALPILLVAYWRVRERRVGTTTPPTPT